MTYFTLSELEYSATAKRKGISNVPTLEHRKHLEEMTECLLDKLRLAWGKPIYVSSGYRGYALNKAVGGSNTSAHSYGYAVDLIPCNHDIQGFKLFVKNWLKKNKIAFDQYIDETRGDGSAWLHLGFKHYTGNNSYEQRFQFLSCTDGRHYTTIE